MPAASPRANAPVLVLLPGLDGTDVFFRPLVAALAPAVAVRAVELPQDGPQTYEALTERVAAAVADLDTMIVVGFSFGGPIAIALASRDPARVRGLALVATFVRSPRPRLQRWRVFARTPTIWMMRFVRRLPVWLLRGGSDPRRIAKSETWSRVPASVIAGRTRAIAVVDAFRALSGTTQPLLVVEYSDDEAVPAAALAEVQRAREARVVRLTGPHLAMFEAPAPLAAELVRLLEQVQRDPESPYEE